MVLLGLVAACGGGSPGASQDSGTARIVRGPCLGRATATSMVVAWRTDRPVAGAVEYGPTAAYGSVAAGGAPATEHAVELTGLQPGAAIFYRVTLDGAAGAPHSFRTLRDDAAPLRFVAFGDSGGPSIVNTTRPALVARVLADAPEFVLHTGDVIYFDGRPGELDPSYFEPFAALIARIPVFLSLGNHDVRTDDGSPLLDAVHLPGLERYYSFERGPVHVIALDTNSGHRPGSPQRTWLEADLAAAATARWIVVFFHHPPYSSSLHGSHNATRDSLAALFETAGVDLVLNGHDHDYERTYPLRADQPVGVDQEPDFVDPAGPVYVVTGGGGIPLYQDGRSAFTAFSRSVFHHVRVDIAGDRLDLAAVDRDGTVFDRMSITKTP